MFNKILDCPTCGESFSYEHEGSIFPDKITCPLCNADNEYSNYSALTFCSECRSKLKVPLDILFDPDIACPQCGSPIRYDAVVSDDATTFVPDGADTRQLYRRMLKDGEMIDKYKVIRLLGKGGMAEVYLADHLLLKKKCALKIMRSSTSSDDTVYIKRFMREAKLTHQFNHPNIVRVFDVPPYQFFLSR